MSAVRPRRFLFRLCVASALSVISNGRRQNTYINTRYNYMEVMAIYDLKTDSHVFVNVYKRFFYK